MWSASGLLGSRPASQVRRTWQMGQCSSPAARALRLAAAALWSQRVVPVREVAIVPPRARVRRPAPHAAVRGRWPRFSPFPSPQKGGNSGAQRLVDGWAPTVCLRSYDARFSRSAQVAARAGVLRFGHRLGVFVVGRPLSFAPCPRVVAPAPLFDGGAPCFEGGGVLAVGPRSCTSTPLCCDLPRCLHTLLGVAFIQYVGIH